MNKNDLKKGDFVKVLRKPTKEEIEEWGNTWEEDADEPFFNMNNAIGKVHQVILLYDKGATLYDEQANYEYPYCVLEKVDKP